MYCTKCGAVTRVVTSARNDDGYYRYRKCPKCGQKVYTVEMYTSDKVVKRHLSQKTKENNLRRWMK